MNNGIIVLAEHFKGNISDITFEMLGIGRKIADNLQIPLYAVILGKDVKSLISNLGIADSILMMDDEKLEMSGPVVIANILKDISIKKEASLILLGGTNMTYGVGPFVSTGLNIPFLNFAKNINIDNESLIVTSQLFGGKIFSDVNLPDKKAVISCYPGSFPIEAGKLSKLPPVEDLGFPEGIADYNFKKYLEPEAGDIDVTKEDVLISVGRGIENSDNISLAEDLVECLGGAVCASRPVIDQGWLPLSRQIGKSGMIVKPKLYFALGISGAPEHVEGMKDSQLILAINKDPSAPIFNVAHFGVCADLNDVVPVLIEKLKKKK